MPHPYPPVRAAQPRVRVASRRVYHHATANWSPSRSYSSRCDTSRCRLTRVESTQLHHVQSARESTRGRLVGWRDAICLATCSVSLPTPPISTENNAYWKYNPTKYSPGTRTPAHDQALVLLGPWESDLPFHSAASVAVRVRSTRPKRADAPPPRSRPVRPCRRSTVSPTRLKVVEQEQQTAGPDHAVSLSHSGCAVRIQPEQAACRAETDEQSGHRRIGVLGSRAEVSIRTLPDTTIRQ